MIKNNIELLLGLDLPKAVKDALVVRFRKIATDKLVVVGQDVTLVPKYDKEYVKGIDGLYYVQKKYSQRWLSLDTTYNGRQIILQG